MQLIFTNSWLSFIVDVNRGVCRNHPREWQHTEVPGPPCAGCQRQCSVPGLRVDRQCENFHTENAPLYIVCYAEFIVLIIILYHMLWWGLTVGYILSSFPFIHFFMIHLRSVYAVAMVDKNGYLSMIVLIIRNNYMCDGIIALIKCKSFIVWLPVYCQGRRWVWGVVLQWEGAGMGTTAGATGDRGGATPAVEHHCWGQVTKCTWFFK